jgi:hypothetical protein
VLRALKGSRSQALAACVWVVLMLPLSAASQVLRCHIESSDQTLSLELNPTQDIYDVRSLNFENGFRFTAVWLAHKQQLKTYVYYSLKITDIYKIKEEILKLKPILMMSDKSILDLQAQGFTGVNPYIEQAYASTLTQKVNKVQYNYAIVKYLNDFLKVEANKQGLNSRTQPYGEKTMEHIISINQKLSSTTADLDKEYYKKIRTINDILKLDNIEQPSLKIACTSFKQIHNLLITQYTHLYQINKLVSNNQGRLTGKKDEKYEYIRILYNELQIQEKIFSDNLHIINNILKLYFSTCLTSTLKK